MISYAQQKGISWTAWDWSHSENNEIFQAVQWNTTTNRGMFGQWMNNPWGEGVSVSDPNSVMNTSVRPVSLFPIGTTSLEPVDDAYVRGGSYASSNFGSDTGMMLKEDTNPIYDRQVYLKFDTSAYPDLERAFLSLVPIGLGSNVGDLMIRIRILADANDNWDESTITWNNKPASTGSDIYIDGADLEMTVPYNLNVTTLLTQAANANDIVSFQLSVVSAAESQRYANFGSKEQSNSGFRPILSIVQAQGSGVEEGYRYITSDYTGKVMRPKDAGTTDNTLIVQYTNNGWGSQQWEFLPTSDGYYNIVNKYTGKALRPLDASTAVNANIVQYTLNTNWDSQKWSLVPNGDAYNIINKYTGLALRMKDAGTDDNVEIVQYTLNTSWSSLKWYIDPID